MNLKPLKSSGLNLQFQDRNGVLYLHKDLQVLTKNLFLKIYQKTLSIIVNQYKNIFIPVHLNVDLLNPKCDLKNHFFDLRDIFALTNLIKYKTCFKNKNNTLSDVLLTNKRNCFQKTTICESGLCSCHKLVLTIFNLNS